MADIEQAPIESKQPEVAEPEAAKPEAEPVGADKQPDSTTGDEGASEDKAEVPGDDTTTTTKPTTDSSAIAAATDGDATNDTGNGDISYFWNVPCKRYLVKTSASSQGRKGTVPILIHEEERPPTEGAAATTFVQTHNLKHGDVLAFSEERDSASYIVRREADRDEYTIVANPDDSNAGYLTIPRSVMEPCDNGVAKYQVIIRESVAINLHVSPRDAFLRKKFGEGEIPHVWDFDIHFSYGELEEIYVRTPGADWEAFDAEETTLEDIKDFFESGRHYMAEFTVTVELEGEKLEEYRAKYGDEDDKYAWMQALPEIPPSWKLVKGESSGADDEYCWEWMLSGPEEDEEEVRESVAHFLRGFEHKFH